MDGNDAFRTGDLPAGEGRAASEAELRRWVAAVAGAEVTDWRPISGGNRCRSWAVRTADGGPGLYLRYQPPRRPSAEPYTVWREASFYRALEGSGVPAPRLIAVHDEAQAILTELAPGRADFRRLHDPDQKTAIARDLMQALARLHALPLDRLGEGAAGRIAPKVAQEIAIWRAMYRETGRDDALIDLALDWLAANLPDPDAAPAFVHGDAGPGNFLFEDGRMTALLDWELAHVGDPMEDLAWFSMRCVMEPVPDFAAAIREYETATGRPVDVARIRYHRVFVSTRVVIIRHHNVTGEPGNSIVSRALNRRLLVDALAAATGIVLPAQAPLEAEATELTPLYDAVIADLRDRIAGAAGDPAVIAAAKGIAKVMKYLREQDRIGAAARAARAEALAALDAAPGALPFADRLAFLAGEVAREAQIAAPSSGGLATRTFPALEDRSA